MRQEENETLSLWAFHRGPFVIDTFTATSWLCIHTPPTVSLEEGRARQWVAAEGKKLSKSDTACNMRELQSRTNTFPDTDFSEMNASAFMCTHIHISSCYHMKTHDKAETEEEADLSQRETTGNVEIGSSKWTQMRTQYHVAAAATWMWLQCQIIEGKSTKEPNRYACFKFCTVNCKRLHSVGCIFFLLTYCNRSSQLMFNCIFHYQSNKGFGKHYLSLRSCS